MGMMTGDNEDDEEEGEGEGGDDDNWEDASDDATEEENEEDVQLTMKRTASDSQPPAKRRRLVNVDKVFSAEDISLMNKLRAQQGLPISSTSVGGKGKKINDKKVKDKDITTEATEESQSNEESDEDDSDNDSDKDNHENPNDYILNPEKIMPGGKLHKSSKIERLKQILSGRTEKKFVNDGHAGGLTNKEKLRKKNYVMVRRGKRSVMNKGKRASSEKRTLKAKHVSIIILKFGLPFNHLHEIFIFFALFT